MGEGGRAQGRGQRGSYLQRCRRLMMGARRECQGGAANRVRGQGAEGREGAGSSQALEGGNGQGERE